MTAEEGRTVWVGNLSDSVNEELLYELFLQAGPLEYVRQPKDKASGRKKNFAFICYRHDCSVPYAITLMQDIKLCGRNMRVQSRYLQDLQERGLASYDHGGVQSLCPVEEKKPSMNSSSTQASLLGAPPPMMIQNLKGKVPVNIPPHILALAQQQMASLNANRPMPLSQNPLLNARLSPRNDRYGSINYNRGHQSPGERSQHGYNRYQDNRSRGPRQIDNKTMRGLKSHSEDIISQNSQMLANIQDRQDRFDNRRGGDYHGQRGGDYQGQRGRDHQGQRGGDYQSQRGGNYQGHRGDFQDSNKYQQDRDNYHRPSNRDYRQQPYDRHDSHRDRNHERRGSHESRRRHDDRSGASGHRSYSNDRYDRGHHGNSQHGSRR